MKTSIQINQLKVLATHGVLEVEKVFKQPFEINLDLEVNFLDAAVKDDLNLSVDYSFVSKKVTTLIQENSFNLIETLAMKIVDDLLAIPRINSVSIELKKLQPLMETDVGSVQVTITKDNPF